ncbi:MAG: DMT family transporter [Clostridiales bacterium]|nr:DMT family transporter [Clostridiales bacterium]
MYKRILSAVYVILAGCLWGCMGLLVRPVSGILKDSIQIVFFRAAVSTLVLLLGLLIFNPKALVIKLKDLWCFVGTGIFSITFFNFCYFNTIKIMDLSVAAVLLYTSPAFVIILSAILFKEKVGKVKVFALALSFAGCVLVSGIVNTGSPLNAAGIIYGLGAGFGYALYSIFSRYAINRGYNSFTITFYTFLLSMLATSFMCDAKTVVYAFSGQNKLFWYAAFMVILVTLLPYVLFTIGLMGMDNGKASVLASIEPVMATVVGIAAYGETPDLFVVAGMTLVLASIAIINNAEKN